MKFALFAAVAAGATSAAASTTGLLVPLYFYPNEKTCWPEVRALGKSHPNLPLTLIVNPNSGPTGLDTDDGYTACLPALRQALPRAKIVGYVSTYYGERPAQTVNTNVGIYKSWASGGLPNGGSVALDGIFFDELNPDATNATNLALYTSYVNNVRSQFGAKSWVVLNPGDPAPAPFYSLADMIVSYESAYKTFKIASVAKNTSAKQPASKQAIMVYNVPSSKLSTVVKQVAPAYGWTFLTDLDIAKTDVYGKLPGFWSAEVAAVDPVKSVTTAKTVKQVKTTTKAKKTTTTKKAKNTTTTKKVAAKVKKTTTSKKATKTKKTTKAKKATTVKKAVKPKRSVARW